MPSTPTTLARGLPDGQYLCSHVLTHAQSPPKLFNGSPEETLARLRRPFVAGTPPCVMHMLLPPRYRECGLPMVSRKHAYITAGWVTSCDCGSAAHLRLLGAAPPPSAAVTRIFDACLVPAIVEFDGVMQV